MTLNLFWEQGSFSDECPHPPLHTDPSSTGPPHIQSYIPLRGHAITTYYTHRERQEENK